MSNTTKQATETPAVPSNQVRLGGAWVKTSSYGQFFSLLLDAPSLEALNKLPLDDRGNLRLCLFPVKEKKTDKSPDYNLIGYLEQAAAKPVTPSAPAKAQTKVAAKPTVRPAVVEDVGDDDGIL